MKFMYRTLITTDVSLPVEFRVVSRVYFSTALYIEERVEM